MSLLSKIADQYRFTKKGIPLREKFLLALPGPALSLSSVLIHNVYIKLYTDIIKLDPMYVAMIYFWFNIWNLLNDPVFGVLIDRKKYDPRKGKFLYIMRVTVPFMVLCLAAMLFSQPAWPQTVIFAVLLVELFLFDTAATFFGIASNCYFLLAAPTKEERVDVDVLRNYIANIVSFFATLVPTLLLVGNANSDRTQIVAILMGVIVLNTLLYAVAVVKLKERPEMYARGNTDFSDINLSTLWKDVRSILTMKAFWTWFFYSLLAFAPGGIYFTAFLYFMDHVIKSGGVEATLVDTVPMLLVFLVLPVIGTMVKKAGGKRAILVGMLPYAMGYGLLLFCQTWWQALLCYVPIMFGRYLASTAGGPLGAAIIDENERATGTRKTGLFGAVNAILAAPVGGLQMIIFMAILTAFGYDENAAAQSAQAMLGIRLATAAVPIVFCLAGVLPLLLFPYDKQKEAELSAFSEARRRGRERPSLPACRMCQVPRRGWRGMPSNHRTGAHSSGIFMRLRVYAICGLIF